MDSFLTMHAFTQLLQYNCQQYMKLIKSQPNQSPRNDYAETRQNIVM